MKNEKLLYIRRCIHLYQHPVVRKGMYKYYCYKNTIDIEILLFIVIIFILLFLYN